MKYNVILQKPFEVKTIFAGSIQEADKKACRYFPMRLASVKSFNAKIR
jgi:hypothetical protein